MLVGYARVSSQGQSLDRQIGALNTIKADRIFREVASGRTVKGRPQLERAIDALGAGDVLVIAEWDRATRSMMDGINIIQRVADRSATVKVLDKPWLDLTTPMGKGILAFLSALVEDERERITRRANEGRQIAIANGTKFGRKPKLTDHQRQLARQRMADGDTCRCDAPGGTYASHRRPHPVPLQLHSSKIGAAFRLLPRIGAQFPNPSVGKKHLVSEVCDCFGALGALGAEKSGLRARAYSGGAGGEMSCV